MSKVAITGAFSYSGRYLTRLMLDQGVGVVNLSRRTSPIGGGLTATELQSIQTHPLSFDEPSKLAAALEGCETLYCTYWIRFTEPGNTHTDAIRRVSTLFEEARKVGVKRIVYSSHTQASVDSPYEYIRCKAEACEALRNSGIPSYAIVRPCGIFGDTPNESILLNNAAWVMRRVPLFLLPKTGQERFQPIHVRDMADLMYKCGQEYTENMEKDACGPDAPTAMELFTRIKQATGSYAPIWAPGFLSEDIVTKLSQPINMVTGDVLLDTDDLCLLTSGLTTADNPDDPDIKARRSVLQWIDEVGPQLGNHYVSSMKRYYSIK